MKAITYRNRVIFSLALGQGFTHWTLKKITFSTGDAAPLMKEWSVILIPKIVTAEKTQAGT